MYQSYLLLRNNEQTGPYTLEQLLQLNLKPFDLVWEEGRSAAWRYPGEIDSLQACMMEGPELLCNSLHKEDLSKQESPVTSLPKKVFVSMPGRRPVQQAFAPPVDEPNLDTDAIIRQKAEELRLRVQNYAEQKPRQEYQPLMERQENNFSYFQKSTRKNKLSHRHLIILSGLVLIAFVTWYFIPSATPGTTTVKPIATLPSPAVTELAGQADPDLETKTPIEITPADPVKITPNVSQNKKVESNIKLGNKEPLAEEKQVAHINKDVPGITESKDPIPVIEPEMKANEPVTNKKEKKKLREVVRNIFNPKEKDKNSAVEEETPRPATGRKSNKRAETNLETPDTEQLRAQIDVSSNDRGNWMMGVSGLKITVRNRNNLSLRSVIVIVSYFDSNKKLLEKKELNFRNITANGKMTLAAPEHRWADHTELSLGAVEIAEDAYAIDR